MMKIQKLLTAALLTCFAFRTASAAENESMIDRYLPDDFYSKLAEGKAVRIFYPPFADRRTWNVVGDSAQGKQMKPRILAEAEAILKEPVPSLSTYDYFRFVLEGDRARFERAYFLRRNNLGTLTVAMCLSGNREKYLPAVIDYLGAIMTELYWCDHAHAKPDNDPMPDFETAERVDLFAAETAQQVALTIQLLRDELSSVSPRFLRFCTETTLRKTVLPVLRNYGNPAIHGWTRGNSNWTPWCASSIQIAGAILLDDPAQLADLTRKMSRSCSGFFMANEDSGYCDEGPGYWLKGAGELFRFCRALNVMVPGSAEKIFHDPKFRRMGEFGAMMVIHGRDQVMCSDSGHISNDGIHSGFIYDFGRAIRSDLLESFALNRLNADPRRRALTPEEAAVSRFGTGDRLSALLDYFFKLPANPDNIPRAALPPASFWAERMGIIRNADGFSAALKGGNNAEKHNHNDLGHFTLYYKGLPLIVDLGTGMYSRKNFGKGRYSLFYTSACGHNALRFGEQMQREGAEFSCKLSMPDAQTLSADLSSAYPAEAGVIKYTRTLQCTPNQAVLTDEFALKKPSRGELTLYSPLKVEKLSDGSLEFDGAVRCVPDGAVCLSADPVSPDEIPRHWGCALTRIRIVPQRNKFSFIFKTTEGKTRP